MTDRGHVYQAGEDPLAAHPMTPEQIAAFVEYVRDGECPGVAARIAAGNQWRRRAEPPVAPPPRTAPARRSAPSKLSDADVVAIREAREAGAKLDTLAAEYAVSISTICEIARGKRRKTAGGPLASRLEYTRGTW
jgi:hypothetical protein